MMPAGMMNLTELTDLIKAELRKNSNSRIQKMLSKNSNDLTVNVNRFLEPATFFGLCRYAGKQTGASFNGKTNTLGVILEVIKNNFDNLDHKVKVQLGLDNKNAADITHLDLLELGLFHEVSTEFYANDENALEKRGENLIRIYSSNNQDTDNLFLFSAPDYVLRGGFKTYDLYKTDIHFIDIPRPQRTSYFQGLLLNRSQSQKQNRSAPTEEPRNPPVLQNTTSSHAGNICKELAQFKDLPRLSEFIQHEWNQRLSSSLQALCLYASYSSDVDQNGRCGENLFLDKTTIAFRGEFAKMSNEVKRELGLSDKQPTDITHFDLMEIAVVGKVNTASKTSAEIATRNRNLMAIHAGKIEFKKSDNLYQPLQASATTLEQLLLNEISDALKIKNGFSIFGGDSKKVVAIKTEYADFIAKLTGPDAEKINAIIGKIAQDIANARRSDPEKLHNMITIFKNAALVDSAGDVMVCHTQPKVAAQRPEEEIELEPRSS